MTGDSVVLSIRCTASATVQSVHVHAHIVCVYFFVYRRPTLILSNVWEIFPHFQKLGKGASICCPFDLKPFSFRGLCPPNPLTRGSAPGPRWGLRPQTPLYARAPRSPCAHPTFKLLPPPLVMPDTEVADGFSRNKMVSAYW